MEIDDDVLATVVPNLGPFVGTNGVTHRNGTILRAKLCLISEDILVDHVNE